MKIIKRVRYQRVPHSQLEHGDDYTNITGSRCTKRPNDWDVVYKYTVLALDTDKYPPEVTWDIVGISDEDVWKVQDGFEVFSGTGCTIVDHETVYE